MGVSALRAALGERDPETLIGPLLYLFTRLAHRGGESTLVPALSEHLIALALHPQAATPLRLAAGALAIEYRTGSPAAEAAARPGQDIV